MNASMAQAQPGDGIAGQVPAEDLEDELFGGLRQQLESMIGWARSDEALALEHDQFESRTLTVGFEVMRIFPEAHMGAADLARTAARRRRRRRREPARDRGGRPGAYADDGVRAGPHLADRLQALPQAEPVSPGRGPELG